jgi:hypothetical protein
MNVVFSRPSLIVLVVAVVAVAMSQTVCAQPPVTEGDLGREPTWTIPTQAEVRTRILAWLKTTDADDATRGRVTAMWPADDKQIAKAGKLLEAVAVSIAMVDPSAAKLTAACGQPHKRGAIPDYDLLTSDKTPTFVRNNLRLFFGRWLAQHRLYDESLEQLRDLTPQQVVDPASLLFYQGVAYHWLLQKEDALETLDKLLERREVIPRRHAALAELMRTDLAPVKDESLDHIGRRVKDLERRLELGRAGDNVQKIQKGVIESLDKLIKKLEDQQEEAEGGGSSGESGPATPAKESRIAGGKGKGEVTRKSLGGEGKSWGALSPKDREKALQQIGPAYPSHYRDVIEDYFRRLAAEKNEENKSKRD